MPEKRFSETVFAHADDAVSGQPGTAGGALLLRTFRDMRAPVSGELPDNAVACGHFVSKGNFAD